MFRLFGLVLLALGIAMSAQAAPRHHSLRDATNGGLWSTITVVSEAIVCRAMAP
jgi:hypothetical protein